MPYKGDPDTKNFYQFTADDMTVENYHIFRS